MEDRRTKTMRQVYRATYQKEEASGPRKPVPRGAFGYCGLAYLHWEGKRREVFGSVRNWYDVGGTENGALLIPPLCPPGTAVQYLRFPIQVPDSKHFRRTQAGAKKVFLEGLVRGIRCFSKKSSRLVAD